MHKKEQVMLSTAIEAAILRLQAPYDRGKARDVVNTLADAFEDVEGKDIYFPSKSEIEEEL